MNYWTQLDEFEPECWGRFPFPDVMASMQGAYAQRRIYISPVEDFDDRTTEVLGLGIDIKLHGVTHRFWSLAENMSEKQEDIRDQYETFANVFEIPNWLLNHWLSQTVAKALFYNQKLTKTCHIPELHFNLIHEYNARMLGD